MRPWKKKHIAHLKAECVCVGLEPRGVNSDFQILYKCLMKILLANRIAPDGTPHFGCLIWGYTVCL